MLPLPDRLWTVKSSIERYTNWPRIIFQNSNLRCIRHPTVKLVLRRGTSDEYTMKEIFFRKCYTKHFEIEPESVVVDIGANFGAFSIYAWGMGAKSIYAYEPSPSNYDALVRNIELNAATKIVPQRVAIHPEFKKTRLFVSQRQHNDFDNIFSPLGKSTVSIEVECSSLDEIMEKYSLDKIDFLKMDAEGIEHEVVAKSKKLGSVRKISMESHDIPGHNKEEIIERLQELGFEVQAENNSDCKNAIYVYAKRL